GRGGPLEGVAVGGSDLTGEARVVAARLAVDAHVIGDHVGGHAGAAAVLPAEAADVRRPFLAALPHLAEPAAAVNLRPRQRPDHRRRDAALGVDPGVRRPADDLPLPALGADRPDGDLARRVAVHVEAQLRVAQVARLDVTRPPQAALLADREQRRQWAVR